VGPRRRDRRGRNQSQTAHLSVAGQCSRALVIVSLIGVPGFCLGYLLSWDWPMAALIALVGAVGAAIADNA
jgi:hypothetical protein